MKVITYVILGVVLALGSIYAMWRAFWYMTYDPKACIDEEKLKVENIPGLRFTVGYENCDTLAKTEEIIVLGEQTAADGARFGRNQRNRRTLLFSYDPGSYDNPLPSITHPSPSTILISVPKVSSIFCQNRNWANMSFNHEIGRVDYPAVPKEQCHDPVAPGPH